jgi:type I restriction enzyme, S subunit
VRLIRPLGELCDILDSKRKPITKKDRASGEFPYYGATGVLDYVEDYIFDEKLILIGEDGAKWGAGENTAFSAEGKYWVNNHAHVIRPHRDLIIDEWIIYHLNGNDLSPFITGLTVPKLNQAKLRDIPIPLPPLSEQKRIVAILDEAFEGIGTAVANAEKNLANARELFESYLQSVFIQCGEGWVARRLGDVFEIGSSKRILETEWTPAGVPFYGGKEIVKLAKFGAVVSNAYISEEKYLDYASKYDMPRQNDILITARGTIGVGYVVQEGDKFYYKDGNIISMRGKIPTNPDFILYAFRSNVMADQLGDLTGTTVRHLPIQKAKELVLTMPSFAVQNTVAEQIRKIEEQTQSLEAIYQQKLDSLADLKQAILQKAFAGELTAQPERALREAAAA